jgi:FixJ family two-component response regulator
LESQPRAVAVIEDDASMRKGVERLLNAHGFPTEGYASAETFLHRDPENAVACIVLDIQLGGMSGLELGCRLQASDPGLPVIFITAVDDDVVELEATRLGCIAYLHKPFPADLLIDAIHAALAAPSKDPNGKLG